MKPKQPETNIIIHAPPLVHNSGGRNFILILSKKLAKSYKITLMSRLDDKDLENDMIGNDIIIYTKHRIIANYLLYWLIFPFTLVYEVIITFYVVKKNDVLFSFLFPSNIICTIVSLIKGNRHFHYCFEPLPQLHNKIYINSQKRFIKYFLLIYSSLFKGLDKLAISKAHKLFTLNQITRKMIINVYNRVPIVTLMGVDANHFKPAVTCDFNDIKPFIIHSTDYSVTKNTDLAIKAFYEVQQRKKKCYLVITSTRPNAAEKENYVNLVNKLNLNNSVIFMDLVSYEKLPVLYSNALVYLSCSYDEMLGTTSSNLPVKESLACGSPAIRAAITTEDVEDNISGFLVDPRNSVQIAKKIIYFLNNPKIARKMGMEGRKKIVRLYKWNNVAKIILKHIESKND